MATDEKSRHVTISLHPGETQTIAYRNHHAQSQIVASKTLDQMLDHAATKQRRMNKHASGSQRRTNLC